MTVGQRTRFFAAFAEALLRFNRGPLHLIIDEAHLFAPQGRVNDPQSGAMLHAANNLVSLGRGRGLRIILISQRPAKLHKDSLTQVETLIAMRLIAPQDRAAVKDWVGEWADATKGAEIIASLPSLPRGDAWVWSPQIDYLERTHFPLAATFDSGTAEANSAARELPSIDLAQIGERMDTIRQEAMANDPKRLKARIVELERAALAAPLAGATKQELDAAYELGKIEGYADGRDDAGRELGQRVLDFAANFALASGIPKVAAEVPREGPKAAPVSTPIPKVQMAAKPTQNVAQTDMSPSSVKLVDAIVAAYPIGMSLETAAKRAGLSKRSSAFRRYLTEAASSPRIKDRGDGRYVAVAAEEGIKAPSGLDDFKRSLPPSCARMLEVLAADPTSTIPRDEVADRSGVSRTSSGLSAGLKELVALGLADDLGGSYRLSQDFA